MGVYECEVWESLERSKVGKEEECEEKREIQDGEISTHSKGLGMSRNQNYSQDMGSTNLSTVRAEGEGVQGFKVGRNLTGRRRESPVHCYHVSSSSLIIVVITIGLL